MTYNQHALIKDSTIKLPLMYRFESKKIKPQDLSDWLAKGKKIKSPANNFGKLLAKPKFNAPVSAEAMTLYLARQKSSKAIQCNADYSRDK